MCLLWNLFFQNSELSNTGGANYGGSVQFDCCNKPSAMHNTRRNVLSGYDDSKVSHGWSHFSLIILMSENNGSFQYNLIGYWRLHNRRIWDDACILEKLFFSIDLKYISNLFCLSKLGLEYVQKSCLNKTEITQKWNWSHQETTCSSNEIKNKTPNTPSLPFSISSFT